MHWSNLRRSLCHLTSQQQKRRSTSPGVPHSERALFPTFQNVSEFPPGRSNDATCLFRKGDSSDCGYANSNFWIYWRLWWSLHIVPTPHAVAPPHAPRHPPQPAAHPSQAQGRSCRQQHPWVVTRAVPTHQANWTERRSVLPLHSV